MKTVETRTVGPGSDTSAKENGLRLLGIKVLQYGPGALGPAVLGVLTSVIYTRVFDTAQFGRYSLVLTVTTLLAAISSQWLQQAVNRFVPAEPEINTLNMLKKAIVASFILIALVVAVAGGVLISLGMLVLAPEWKEILWPAALLVLLTALYNGLASVLQGEMKAARYSVYQLGLVSLRFALSAFLVFSIYRQPPSLVWAAALAPLALIPFLWRDAALPHVRDVAHGWPQTKALVKQFAAYGFPMVGWVLSAALLNASDRYVIQFFRGSHEVGIYSANYGLVSSAAGLIASPMLLAAHPFLIQAWGTGDRAEAASWLGKIVSGFTIAGCLLSGAGYIFAKDLALWLLGSTFREGYRIMPVVLAGTLLWQLGMYVHKPLEFTGQTGRMLWYGILAAVLNILSNLLLVPIYGYTAAGYTTLGAYAFYVAIAAWAGRRVLPWSIPWKPFLVSILVVLAGVGLAAAVRPIVESTLGYWTGIVLPAVVLLATAAIVIRGVIWSFSKQR